MAFAEPHSRRPLIAPRPFNLAILESARVSAEAEKREPSPPIPSDRMQHEEPFQLLKPQPRLARARIKLDARQVPAPKADRSHSRPRYSCAPVTTGSRAAYIGRRSPRKGELLHIGHFSRVPTSGRDRDVLSSARMPKRPRLRRRPFFCYIFGGERTLDLGRAL